MGLSITWQRQVDLAEAGHHRAVRDRTRRRRASLR
jgi:hypothetical protein